MTAITNAMTVMFWAKGVPGRWNPWVSKYGEGPGWQLRVNAALAPTGPFAARVALTICRPPLAHIDGKLALLCRHL